MPRTHSHKAQKKKSGIPPLDTDTALMEMRRYRLEFLTSTNKDPHEFVAASDEDALQKVANHLFIACPCD